MENGSGFYLARDAKIEMLLSAPSRELSNEQKEYWQGVNREVNTPFTFGYYEGWTNIISGFELLTFALFAVCIVIALFLQANIRRVRMP